jgi:hypothetical protein
MSRITEAQARERGLELVCEDEDQKGRWHWEAKGNGELIARLASRTYQAPDEALDDLSEYLEEEAERTGRHYIRMGEAANRLGVDYRRLRMLVKRYNLRFADNPLDLREKLLLSEDVDRLAEQIADVKKAVA